MSILKPASPDIQKRTEQLDTLAAILPMDRRDRLAELLTEQDVETLRHLAKHGIGENNLRALTSDLAYLEAWARAATGYPLPWPASATPSLKSAIRLAVRAINQPRARKSANAITADILTKMLATCRGNDLRARRDRAILMVAFASGGRRRSEIAGLRVAGAQRLMPLSNNVPNWLGLIQKHSPPMDCVLVITAAMSTKITR